MKEDKMALSNLHIF